MKALASIIFTIRICIQIYGMRLCKSSTVMIETSEPVHRRSRSRLAFLLQLAVQAVGYDPEVDVDQEFDSMDPCDGNISVADRCNFVLSGFHGRVPVSRCS